jgi:hypothetical protein
MGIGHSLIGPYIGAGIGLVGQGNFSIFAWNTGDRLLVTSGLGVVSVCEREIGLTISYN